MNKFQQFARNAINKYMKKFLIYAPENIDAQLEAMQHYFKSLESNRTFESSLRGFSYPFNMNQAEWERSVFTRGWNACLDWVRKELANEDM